ncbi:hypothetical protein CLOSYM_03990 [[Clostridium] symbiosum ATCC 14940]|uniref:Uncharacterized protein n=1 Tax=[Clostridium] symbiosum ATCC 14940 TaxID=411472 RepID=A0ABC9TT34_CLOSY|nr:hypothetical protein CLOSYM_03990 [[Clostridium] symbiosum ATCC 14940]
MIAVLTAALSKKWIGYWPELLIIIFYILNHRLLHVKNKRTKSAKKETFCIKKFGN